MTDLLAYVERHPWWALTYLICVLSAIEAFAAIKNDKK